MSEYFQLSKNTSDVTTMWGALAKVEVNSTVNEKWVLDGNFVPKDKQPERREGL